jgi:hypothetical protein
MTLREMINFMTDMQAEYEFDHFCEIDYINTIAASMEHIANDMMWNAQV